MKIEIRLAQIGEKEIIIELLNKVTLHLHEKGIKQWYYPWDSKEIFDDIKNEFVYVLAVNDTIIGTFSIKDTDHINVPLIKKQNKYLYRIAISPKYFGKKLGQKSVIYAIELSKGLNKALYLDCWAGNDKLREFYTNAGFDFIGNVPEEDYMISVFKYQ